MIRFCLRTGIQQYLYNQNQLFRFARKQTPQQQKRKNLIADDVEQDGKNDQVFSESDNEEIEYQEQRGNNQTYKSKNNELVIQKNDLMLHIPKTEFNPRFKPTLNEERYHNKIAQNLYLWQQANKNNPEKQYVIHDLPFLTYGEPHLGHFYNKTQQDIAARFAMLNGYKVTHQIGFNLHGQTIQNQAVIAEQLKTKELKRFSSQEIRDISNNFAYESLKNIIIKMSRWGLMTDFSQAYTTNHPFYESGVLKAFYELVQEKSIFLDEKPTLWSVKNRTALDDDEANMEIIPKPGTFIKFEVKNFGNNIFLQNLAQEHQVKVYVIGFTTELWTLNSLRALSVNENVQYGIYKSGDALYVISRNRFKHHRLFFKEENKGTLVSTQTGKQISQLTVFDQAFERDIPVLSCDTYAKNERFGLGIACVCPGHYSKDFQVSEQYDLSKKAHVNKFGRLDQTVPNDLQNLSVVNGEADEHILQKYLDQNLVLDIDENYETEQYFDKKTNEKLIVRTQMTVYSRLPDFEREYFVEQLKEKIKIKISGQLSNKESQSESQEGAFGSLEKQILEKSDNWTISSNQEWGIPIPIFFYINTNQQKYLLEPAVVKHIIGLYEQFGSQIWHQYSIEELLPQKYKNLAAQLEKGQFTFDQWFESGCSWYVMLKSKPNGQDIRQKFLIQQNDLIKQKQKQLSIENKDQDQSKQIVSSSSQSSQASSGEFNIVQKYPCDLAIQGKDQIDSWLLSTSLLSIGLKEHAFFNNLKLHRVIPATNDEKLSKLSQFKSSIDDYIEGTVKLNGERQYGYGVDILRMWVALSDKVREQVNDKKKKKEKNENAIQVAENMDYIFMRPNEFDVPNNYINIFRKCMWNMLGSLKGYNQNLEQIKIFNNGKLSFLSDYMMTQLVLYMINMHRAYQQLDYATNVDLTMDFIKNWVYDFFLDSTKNFIISNPVDPKTQEYLFVYSKIVENLLIAVSPMIPHNAEDIFSNVHFKLNKKESIFHYDWPDMSKEDVHSLQSKIPKQNLLWQLRECIWEQLTFQMERYQNIRSKERYDIVIIVDELFSKEYSILEETCIDELDSFIGAGQVKVHTLKENQEYPHNSISTFKFKTNYLSNEKLSYTIKIYLSENFKCIRCHKYTAIYENTICPHCITYLSTNHKKQCNHLLNQIKRNPQLPIKVIDPKQKILE
ncbi:isoleucyl-tRNA synthetase protein (macronuclear) [Tetrahymena thermophila SB210]|uniref:Isoleucyl-tRNA synthetase protein n=1 Tax=Tetrahymena thermophila (strain SB210) TaxID=312017 RepID=I7MDK0_TETTS|nr:isoleucyl-tRNA synthetase protein [Tetrahymena thermophila SB210]EAR89275.2 isoleucyl-tRNA synthetase protein [Tetrahymena thermophila SB210]|eukprot:XP_001009520.2 isoleucyl-tRNA synthetase protein [Tetrahymena thermophila SB210]